MKLKGSHTKWVNSSWSLNGGSRFPKLHHHSSFAHSGDSSIETEWKTTPTQIDIISKSKDILNFRAQNKLKNNHQIMFYLDSLASEAISVRWVTFK